MLTYRDCSAIAYTDKTLSLHISVPVHEEFILKPQELSIES